MGWEAGLQLLAFRGLWAIDAPGLGITWALEHMRGLWPHPRPAESDSLGKEPAPPPASDEHAGLRTTALGRMARGGRHRRPELEKVRKVRASFDGDEIAENQDGVQRKKVPRLRTCSY